MTQECAFCLHLEDLPAMGGMGYSEFFIASLGQRRFADAISLCSGIRQQRNYGKKGDKLLKHEPGQHSTQWSSSSSQAVLSPEPPGVVLILSRGPEDENNRRILV